MQLRSDEEARAEFTELLTQLGGTKAEAIIMKEVGFKVSRATFYKIKKGECKPTLLHLLTYALRKAAQNQDNAPLMQSIGRGIRIKDGKAIEIIKG
ncbi:hypothetical protein DMW20_11925 [Vibrio parahaemolyticus]|nr:hypothetical protein [Vibrio parahaemolyticus]